MQQENKKMSLKNNNDIVLESLARKYPEEVFETKGDQETGRKDFIFYLSKFSSKEFYIEAFKRPWPSNSIQLDVESSTSNAIQLDAESSISNTIQPDVESSTSNAIQPDAESTTSNNIQPDAESSIRNSIDASLDSETFYARTCTSNDLSWKVHKNIYELEREFERFRQDSFIDEDSQTDSE